MMHHSQLGASQLITPWTLDKTTQLQEHMGLLSRFPSWTRILDLERNRRMLVIQWANLVMTTINSRFYLLFFREPARRAFLYTHL